MENSQNKYGLKRYIPSDIRTKIRKDSGFGCSICGCVLVDYEHIEPEFHQALEHDPDKMTLLCIDCHGRVTRKLISKKAVWEAKANPKALQDGFVHDLLFVNTDEMEIKIGNSTSKNTSIVLTIYGKPIIWFEPPSIEGEPSKLCSIFHDNNGQIISYINRNQFIAYSDNQDVQSKSTKLTVTSNGVNCLLIDREGGSALHITKMQGRYLNTSVSIGASGELNINQGNSSISLGGFYVESCGSAIHLGDPPIIVKYKKLSLAIMLANHQNTTHVESFKKESLGWILKNEIFNKRYELVGFTHGDKVLNIVNEYVGRMDGSLIVHKDNCYETGEPIFTSQENIDFRNKHPNIGYDVSFRLFGNVI